MQTKINANPGPQCFVSSAFSSKGLRQIFTVMGVFLSLLCVGCQEAPPPVVPKPAAGPAGAGLLAAGDVLKLVFPGAPEFNQLQKVRSDGRISLPLIGEVSVAGKTLGDFQAELAALYKSQLQRSEVVVSVEMSAVSVYVSGAVNKPGKILLDRPMTALEVIMEAGGFATDLANPKKVVVMRQENGQHQTFNLDYSPVLKGKPVQIFNVKAYDTIYVSFY